MSDTAPSGVLRASRVALSRGSKSFAAASRLLGREERIGATLIYAWCRHCDDVIDGQVLGQGRAEHPDAAPAERLAELAHKTRGALSGQRTDDDAFAALQYAVRRYDIPHRYPMELLEGFAMDVGGRRYDTLDDVLGYCYHVAGVVGLMMAHIMGVRDEGVLDRACDLGLALQMTNIARDVVEDASVGRVYLPSTWLGEEGIPEDDIAANAHREALARVVARLLDTAAAYYESGDIGIDHLPRRAAWSITVARGVYSEIGDEVRRLGARAWDQRTVVSGGRKLAWVVRGAGRALAWRARAGKHRSRPSDLWERPRHWKTPAKAATRGPLHEHDREHGV